jgi:hypothetical protein
MIEKQRRTGWGQKEERGGCEKSPRVREPSENNSQPEDFGRFGASPPRLKHSKTCIKTLQDGNSIILIVKSSTAWEFNVYHAATLERSPPA